MALLCGDSSAITQCDHTLTMTPWGKGEPCREEMLLGKAADDNPGFSSSCPGPLTLHRGTESSRLEETFTIKSNHQKSIITAPPKPHHPDADASWAPPGMVTPPLFSSLPNIFQCLTTRTVIFIV